MKINNIYSMDKKYYMNTFGDRLPILFEKGNGSKLYDTDNKEYIDFLAGIAVNCLGYNYPKLTKAIQLQAEKLLHISNYYYNIPQTKLSELLIENSCMDKVFFTNSGAESNETAIKLARKYFSNKGMYKYKIITAKNSFHGRTLATTAATGQDKYQKPYLPMPEGFINVPFNNIEMIKEAIDTDTCAVMIELIQGEGGVIEADFNYVKKLCSLCKEYGILLLIDEVQTGVGRTGKLFAYEHYDIEPDIVTLAKALGGGVPIGAVLAKEEVAKSFTPGSHGTTFGGNPLACSAGHCVLSTIINENLLEKVEVTGHYFKEQLYSIKDSYSFIKDVRGRGLMLGMQLDNKISGKKIVLDALKNGFVINCAGNNTLRFVPPLIINKEEINKLINYLKELFDNMEA